MPTEFKIRKGGYEVVIPVPGGREATPEEFREYMSTPRGQADVQRRLQEAQSTGGPTGGPKAPLREGETESLLKPVEEKGSATDIAGVAEPAAGLDESLQKAYKENMQEYIDSLGQGKRFLIGAGKIFDDVKTGVLQLWNMDDDVDKALGEELAAKQRAYDILDEQQIGAEDFGELAMEGGLMALGGAYGATVKGGAVLTGVIEGLKGTESGSEWERASQAATGVASGAIGSKVGNWLSPLRNTADEIASQGTAFTKKGWGDIMAGGIGRIFGLSPSESGRRLISGTAALMKGGREAIEAAKHAAPRITGQTLETLEKAERGKLNAMRADQMDRLGEHMMQQYRELLNKMGSAGKLGVVIDRIGMSLEDVVKKAQRGTRLDGRVVAEHLGSIANKEWDDALSPLWRNRIVELQRDYLKRSDEILKPAQIAAEVDEFVKLVMKGNLDMAKLPPGVQATVKERIRAAGIRALGTAPTAAGRVAAGTFKQGVAEGPQQKAQPGMDWAAQQLDQL